MHNQLTVSEVNAATLAIDAADIRLAMQHSAPSSAAHLSERLFKLPLESTEIDGRPAIIANNLSMTVDTCVDFLQLIVGPVKINKPIRCWLKHGNRWSRIRVAQRQEVRMISEYFV